jgi:hypothetical protein
MSSVEVGNFKINRVFHDKLLKVFFWKIMTKILSKYFKHHQRIYGVNNRADNL